MYIGTVHLHRTEEEVWRMTLRKLMTLWDQHCVFNGWKKEEESTPKGFIDDVF